MGDGALFRRLPPALPQVQLQAAEGGLVLGAADFFDSDGWRALGYSSRGCYRGLGRGTMEARLRSRAGSFLCRTPHLPRSPLPRASGLCLKLAVHLTPVMRLFVLVSPLRLGSGRTRVWSTRLSARTAASRRRTRSGTSSTCRCGRHLRRCSEAPVRRPRWNENAQATADHRSTR